MEKRLGRLPQKIDPRTLMFAKYMAPELLPTVPSACDWTTRVTSPWGMLANDRLGDCTCAGAGHHIMSWTGDNGDLYIPSDSEIIAAYAAVSGYNPITGSGDTGAVMLNVLNYWRQNGIAGRKIGVYASIKPLDMDHIKAAIYLFGGVYLGFNLPLSAQGQATWSLTDPTLSGNAAPRSWGGHTVPALAFDDEGITVITWSQPLKVTWEFFAQYCEESYAIISPDFITGVKAAPNGFSMDQLNADLNAIS